MTVNELIDRLKNIEDKDKEIRTLTFKHNGEIFIEYKLTLEQVKKHIADYDEILERGLSLSTSLRMTRQIYENRKSRLYDMQHGCTKEAYEYIDVRLRNTYLKINQIIMKEKNNDKNK